MSATDHPTTPPATDLAQLARELRRCRQRKLEGIEIRTGNQTPVKTPQLEQLAHQYCEAQGLNLHGRIAPISRLLRDGLDAYIARGCDNDGTLIKELFFGDDTPAAHTKNAGQLLDDACARRGIDKRWIDTKRPSLFHTFGEFLTVFVTETSTHTNPDTIVTTSSLPVPDTTPTPKSMPAPEATPATASDKMSTAASHTAPETHAPVRVGRRRPVRIAITAAVAAAVVAVVWVTTHGATFPLPGASFHRFIGLPANGKTFTETVASGSGAVPFTDPFRVDEKGPLVPFLQPVQVPCKVYSPVMSSIGPQAYWYRIASPPWNNHYYAPANSFANGDPPHGPYTGKDIDPAVPDCPIS
jgi:hypothetical protein